MSALKGQLQGNIQTAASLGQGTRAKDLQAELTMVDQMQRQAAQRALDFYANVSAGSTAFTGTQAELDAMLLKLDAIVNSAQTLPRVLGLTGEAVADNFASSATSALDGFAQKIADGENAISALGDAFSQFAADFLRNIGNMITQQIMLNLVSSALGSIGGGGGATVPVKHGGGIMGHTAGTSRRVSPAWFATVQRFHTGGIAGLKPNEVPAVLERGEEVLTRGDPRHQLNGGGGGGAAPQIKIVNALDAGDMVSQGLSTPAGGQAFMNFIRSNKRAVREVMG